MKLSALVLAAGLSSRMGTFKPLMRIDDRTLIEHTVGSLVNSTQSVTIVLGYRAEEIKKVLTDTFSTDWMHFALNPDYEKTDMLTSIKVGISSLDECDAFYLLPGDMPAIESDTLAALRMALETTNAKVAIPTLGGHRKHPPLIRSSCGNDILSYEGNGGLRGIWRAYADEITEVPVCDRGCLLDADRMSDFLTLSNYLQRTRSLSGNAPEVLNT